MQFLMQEESKPKCSVWDDFVPIIQDGLTYTVFITDQIDFPAQYDKLMYTLNSLQSYHTVIFNINSPGGNSDSGFMIRQGILNCKAKTIARLSGTVASAATFLALACDELFCDPFTSFMAHNYYHGTEGGGSQVKNYVDFTDRELKRAFRVVYTNFLTEEEIVSVTEDDKEIWLNEIETMERWKNYKNPPKVAKDSK